MIDVEHEVIKRTILKLNEAQANWLKSHCQNPMGTTLSNESEADNIMRMQFWVALGGSVTRNDSALPSSR